MLRIKSLDKEKKTGLCGRCDPASGFKEKLLKMLQELQNNSKPFGLQINIEKTKIMSNSEETYKIEDWEIEKVEKFKYLGQTISFKNATKVEMNERSTAAWKSFWALKKFLISELPMFHKKKLMDSVILPIFTYGAQSWTLSKEYERRLKAGQKAMERKILRLSLLDHITNEEIRRTKIKDVLDKLEN